MLILLPLLGLVMGGTVLFLGWLFRVELYQAKVQQLSRELDRQTPLS